MPIGNQAENVKKIFCLKTLFLILSFKFKPEDVSPVLGDILIAKMNPGQVII